MTLRGRMVAATAVFVALAAGCGATATPRGGRAPTLEPSTAAASPTAAATSPNSAPSSPVLPSTAATPPSAVPSATSAAPSGPVTPPSSSTVALPSWLRESVVTRLPTARRVVALTFDGGAGAQGAGAILRTLAQTDTSATFFLTGAFVRDNPALTRQIAAAGGVVGDHTMTHPHLTLLSSAAVVAQVTGAARELRSMGIEPQPWFRFPYGDYDARTLALVHQLGYGAIGWTVDTLGWEGRAAGSADDVITRVKRALRPGAIVLMHLGANPNDGTTYDADALPAIVAAVHAAGYTFTDLRSFPR